MRQHVVVLRVFRISCIQIKTGTWCGLMYQQVPLCSMEFSDTHQLQNPSLLSRLRIQLRGEKYRGRVEQYPLLQLP